MNDRIPLYEPGKVPMRTMRSSVDPSTVQWRLLENIRTSRDSVQGRLGCDELTNGVIVASAEYKGHWVGTLAGTEYTFVALRVSGTTRVYRIDTSGSPWTGTEYTRSTGDATRFSTDGDVIFVPYRELGINDGTNDAGDFLYISNGTSDAPRIFKAGLTGTGSMDLIPNYDVSTFSPGSYRPVPGGYVYVNDPALIAATDSGANVTTAETGSAPLCEVYVTVTTSTATTDWVRVAFGTNSCVNIFGNSETTGDTLNLSRSRQLGIVFYDSQVDPIHNYANVVVVQSGNETQIYDAQGANRVDPAIQSLGGGYYLAAFHLEQSVASGLTAVEAIELEFARTFAASRTFRISGILAMGRIPQGTSYELAWAKMFSRAESPGMVLTAQPTAALSEYGVSLNIPYKFPEFSQFFYAYRIDWGGSTPSGTPTADATFLYRMEPGDLRALFVADMGVSNNPFNDTVPSADRAEFRPSPSPGGRGALSARAGCINNDRLYLGGVNGGTNQVWISDELHPLRFRALATDEDGDGYPDPNSGLSKSFPGEDVYALVPIPGTLVGVSPVACFTTGAVRRFEGRDAASLSRPTLMTEHGTIYPRSIVRNRGSIVYLDGELIVRVFNGGIESPPVSLYEVDDQFESGDMTKACGVVYKERYGLYYRASGASINQRAMQYDIQSQSWVRDSYATAAQNWEGVAIQGSGSSRKLIGFTKEGRIYQLEKSGQTDDDGTAITGTFTTGETHDDMFSQRVWGSVCVVTDAITGGTWTVARVDEHDATNTGSGNGSIDVAVSTTRAYRWETSTKTSQDSAIRAAAVKITISGKVMAGKFLKYIGIKVSKEKATPGGDRA